MSDENEDVGRRISISDSTDGSDYEEVDAKDMFMHDMRIRLAHDLADKISQAASSQPSSSSSNPGPSGASTSRSFQRSFRLSNLIGASSKPLKKRPTMHQSHLPIGLVWADNDGNHHTTSPNFAILRALRDANRKLRDHGSQGSVSDDGSTQERTVRVYVNERHESVDAETNTRPIQPVESEEHIHEDENVSEDSSPDSKRPRLGTEADEENEHVDVETDSTKEIIRVENKGKELPVRSKDLRNSEAPLNQSLLSLLECPVCLECMEPPMAQCRRGHLICSTCRDRMLRCPVCRASFTSVRNRAMEQVAEKLRYPCRHGCSLLVSLRQRADHEGSCVSRLYACPLPACAAPSMQRDQLINHFLDAHPDSVAFGTKRTYRYNRIISQHDWIMSAHSQVFHVQFQTSNRNFGVYGSVTYIGPKKEASKYTYEISIAGTDKSRRLLYSRETHSDLDCRTDHYTQGDSFFVSFDNALTFGKLSGNTNVLIFKVEVHAVKEITADICDTV